MLGDPSSATALSSFATLLPAFVQQYWQLHIWAGAFLLGENFILPLFIFTAEHPSSFIDALPLVLLGTLAADCLWFAVGRYGASRFKIFQILLDKTPRAVAAPVESLLQKNLLVSLIVLKFLFGVRLLLTLYIGTRRELSWQRYLLWNSVAIILFLLILAVLGWTAGVWLPLGAAPSRLIASVVIAIIVLAIIGRLARRLLSREAGTASVVE